MTSTTSAIAVDTRDVLRSPQVSCPEHLVWPFQELHASVVNAQHGQVNGIARWEDDFTADPAQEGLHRIEVDTLGGEFGRPPGLGQEGEEPLGPGPRAEEFALGGGTSGFQPAAGCGPGGGDG